MRGTVAKRLAAEASKSKTSSELRTVGFGTFYWDGWKRIYRDLKKSYKRNRKQ